MTRLLNPQPEVWMPGLSPLNIFCCNSTCFNISISSKLQLYLRLLYEFPPSHWSLQRMTSQSAILCTRADIKVIYLTAGMVQSVRSVSTKSALSVNWSWQWCDSSISTGTKSHWYISRGDNDATCICMYVPDFLHLIKRRTRVMC